MYARVTIFDIDPIRATIPVALERFKALVLPQLQKQPGYEGVCALTTQEGRGLLITYWATEAAAEEGLTTGFYSEQVQKFVAVYREPPGREQYEVSFMEAPRGVTAAA